MTDPEKDNENIFKIMDGTIAQLNKTKKMFIIMILTMMIISPITFLISFAIWGPPFDYEKREHEGPPIEFFHPKIIPLIVILVWLGIGIRQWFVLSKWTNKYEHYKELQEKINKKLDEDDKNADDQK